MEGTMRRGLGACAVTLLLLSCTSDNVTVGAQCPTPASGRATVAPDAGTIPVYGTSCAPCDARDIKLDARGCPELVTWQSCGGDICIGNQRLARPMLDAGSDDDGGSEGDAGEEDGGHE